jgi:dTDP-4-amino-4,6-dideoxygalactose transaminase
MDWKVLLSPPEMSLVEREMLLEAFDGGWLAPAGPDLEAFEAELCELSGAAEAVALSSGTAALQLALRVVGVGAGDDVLISDLTFAAAAFAASHLGARSCFIDSEASSWQLDPELLEEELGRRAAAGALPAAVVAVDLYGSVVDGERLAAACAGFGVPLVEDAAEAVGASRQGRMAGRFGAVGVYSFNGNKIVTTGGGGAIVTDQPTLAGRARHLASQARQPTLHYEHHEVGYNYRLGNINAAVGRGQLRTLPSRMLERARVRAHYEDRLGGMPGVRFQDVPPDCVPNHWLTTVEIDASLFGATAADVLTAVRAAGIEARPGFMPMHLQPVFAGAPVVGGSVSARHFTRSVSLPSSSRLTAGELDWITDVVAGARC